MVKIILKCHGTIVGGLIPLNRDRNDKNKLRIHVYTSIGETCPADIFVSCNSNSNININSDEVPLFRELGFLPEIFPEMKLQNENDNVRVELRTGVVFCKNNTFVKSFERMALMGGENENYKFSDFNDIFKKDEIYLSEVISILKGIYKDEPIDLHLIACLTTGVSGAPDEELLRKVKEQIKHYEIESFKNFPATEIAAGSQEPEVEYAIPPEDNTPFTSNNPDIVTSEKPCVSGKCSILGGKKKIKKITKKKRKSNKRKSKKKSKKSSKKTYKKKIMYRYF